MSIVNSIVQRKAGQASFQRELEHQLPIQAHHVSEGGLRGHSVGDSWPYRVVGKGDGTWEVHRNGCEQRLTGLSIHEAHQKAAALAHKRHSRESNGVLTLELTKAEASTLLNSLTNRAFTGRLLKQVEAKLTATLSGDSNAVL